MAEKYGIKTKVLKGDAATPVSTATCVVFVGYAGESTVSLGKAKYFTAIDEYLSHYHGDADGPVNSTLDVAAKWALNHIDGAWFINCNNTGTDAPSELDGTEIVNCLETALAEICLTTSDVPNIICMPQIQHENALAALVGQCEGGINNVIHAQGFVDCANNKDQIDANGNPVAAEITVPYKSGSLVCGWGECIIGEHSYVPASVVLATRRAVEDAKNTNNVPYRSVGNLQAPIKGVAVDVYGNRKDCTCRQEKMNAVVENGIVSFVNKGANNWYTWGDHTAAVSQGTVEDETYRFDSTVAVLYHILNRFSLKWGAVIDSPMSLMLRDCIISEEQDYLNGLKAMGCLVGDPKCEFRPIDNTADTIGKGQFYFTNIATIVPPAKYLELGIQYTDAGLSAYIES